jgi:hypothetical protein
VATSGCAGARGASCVRMCSPFVANSPVASARLCDTGAPHASRPPSRRPSVASNECAEGGDGEEEDRLSGEPPGLPLGTPPCRRSVQSLADAALTCQARAHSSSRASGAAPPQRASLPAAAALLPVSAGEPRLLLPWAARSRLTLLASARLVSR